jgi:hypothetical protein
VAGTAVNLLVQMFSATAPNWLGIAAGAVSALTLTIAFLAYQRWRFSLFDAATTRKST